MNKFVLKGPIETAIDPATFEPVGIGGSKLLRVTPFYYKLADEVTEWLDSTLAGKWRLEADGKNYCIVFENDADVAFFALRWA